MKLRPETHDQLRLRNLFLRPGQTRTAVEICVADRSPTGFLIGWVEKARHPERRRRSWQHHFRVASADSGYWSGRVRGEYRAGPSVAIDEAISAVLGAAEYGDVLAAWERESGRDERYVGTVDPHQAERLAGLTGIVHQGDGRLEFDNIALAYLRGSPETAPYVDRSYLLHVNPGEAPCQLTRER